MLINLTKDLNANKEAKKYNLPSISISDLATYPLLGTNNNLNNYFYFSFFITLLTIDLFKPATFTLSS